MSSVKSIYETLKVTLNKVIEESPTIKTFVFIPEQDFSFQTGQFIELTLNGFGEAPFTPSSSPLVHNRIDVTVMKTGYVTTKIHELQPGEILGIRGPYGKGYPVNEFYTKEILILGGGCGFAPIRSLLYSLIAEKDKFKRVILCYGAKTPEECIYEPFIQELRNMWHFEVYRTVDHPDENWKESVGVATILLDSIKVDTGNAVAVVCGPPIMMKFGTLKLLDMGFNAKDIYLSMEKNMSCGFGKCGHCMMGDVFVCKDGPVFKYDDIKGYEGIWS